jgi:hypothetical protein
MKTVKEKEFIKVAAQFTIRPGTISLLSEENHSNFKKGSLVMQVSRDKLDDMARPLTLEIIRKKEKGTEKIITKLVLK